MRENANGRGVSALREMEALQNERLNYALSLDRSARPVEFEKAMGQVAELTVYLAQGAMA